MNVLTSSWKMILEKEGIDEPNLSSFLDEIFNKEFHARVIFLEGEMGVGKSTLARELLKKYAGIPSFQGSPTFPVVLQYQNSQNQIFEHIDLYRMESEGELETRGIVDLLWNSNAYPTGGFILIEWMSRFEDLMQTFCTSPPVHKHEIVKIQIEHMAGDRRKLSVFTF